MVHTDYKSLPLPAKCALDMLDAQNTAERSLGKLDGYLTHYFTVYALECDEDTRQSCHKIALARYSLSSPNMQPAKT